MISNHGQFHEKLPFQNKFRFSQISFILGNQKRRETRINRIFVYLLSAVRKKMYWLKLTTVNQDLLKITSLAIFSL